MDYLEKHGGMRPMTEYYTPTTEEVRRAYIQNESTEHYPGVPDERGEGYGWVRAEGVEVFGVRNHQERELAEKEFDRWLDRVKADAWDEGAASVVFNVEPPANGVSIKHWISKPENPYRKVNE